IEALPWLPWDKRLELFNALAARAAHNELPRLVASMVEIPDPKASGPLWDLVGNPATDIGLAWTIESSLSQFYLGARFFGPDGPSADRVKPLVEAATERAANGTEMQRVV